MFPNRLLKFTPSLLHLFFFFPQLMSIIPEPEICAAPSSFIMKSNSPSGCLFYPPFFHFSLLMLSFAAACRDHWKGLLTVDSFSRLGGPQGWFTGSGERRKGHWLSGVSGSFLNPGNKRVAQIMWRFAIPRILVLSLVVPPLFMRITHLEQI